LLFAFHRYILTQLLKTPLILWCRPFQTATLCRPRQHTVHPVHTSRCHCCVVIHLSRRRLSYTAAAKAGLYGLGECLSCPIRPCSEQAFLPTAQLNIIPLPPHHRWLSQSLCYYPADRRYQCLLHTIRGSPQVTKPPSLLLASPQPVRCSPLVTQGPDETLHTQHTSHCSCSVIVCHLGGEDGKQPHSRGAGWHVVSLHCPIHKHTHSLPHHFTHTTCISHHCHV
jgi:hypothetical protein